MAIPSQLTTHTLYSEDYYLCYEEAKVEASDRTKLSLDTFPVIPIGSLQQNLDETWFPNFT